MKLLHLEYVGHTLPAAIHKLQKDGMKVTSQILKYGVDHEFIISCSISFEYFLAVFFLMLNGCY